MSEVEHELFETDILIVGGGMAGLSCAYHLKQLINEYQESKPEDGKDLSEIMITLIEKGPHIGAHVMSGAVMDPKGLAELIPDYIEKGAPLDNQIEEDAMFFLKKDGQFKVPYAPSDMHNKNLYAVSLNRLTGWLGEQAGGGRDRYSGRIRRTGTSV